MNPSSPYKKNKAGLIITGFFIQFTSMSFGRFVYTLILPGMMEELGYSTTQMGLLGTGIVLGYLVFAWASASIAVRIGSPMTVKLSVLLVSVSLFCLGHFRCYAILLAASVGLGAGASGSYIPLIQIMNDNFSRKGTAFGIVMGGAGAGIILSGYIVPPLMNLSAYFGYRLSWYALSGLNGMVLLGSLPTLRSTRRSASSESRIGMKSILPFVLRSRALMLSIISYFAVGFAYIIYVTYFGAYAVAEMSYTEGEAGVMWSLFGLNTVYSGLLWGAVSDNRNKVGIALLITGILFLAVSTIVIFPFKYLFYVSSFLFGLAFLGFITVIASIISSEIPVSHMGRIFGAATLIHSSGQVIGVFLAGIVRDATGSFRISFSLSSLFFLIAVALLVLKMANDK